MIDDAGYEVDDDPARIDVEAHRGHGLGRRLVSTMIDEGPGANFRWLLHTADAHALYRQFGFAEPDHTFMERSARLTQP